MSLPIVISKLLDASRLIQAELSPFEKETEHSVIATHILDSNLPHHLNRLANLCDILADTVLQYQEQTYLEDEEPTD